ncbi:MAG TPA: response regulator [Candidatus Avidesulfovibrio excrementigallinarum]|nr:response regulator [Candidatus Avidesulfovibrio excrementigallinarum]
MPQLSSPKPADTLLIVDDNDINRDLLETIFAPFYPSEQAENGRQGFEAVLKAPEKYCAILLDVVMPEMNGIQVLRHLHDLGFTETIPIFLITAEASDAVTREAYELGVMDVITKPVVPYVVLRRVNSVVELFRSRKILGNKVEEQQSELLLQAQKIIRLNEGMIEALSTAIEFRNGESGEHVRRIHDITHFLLLHTDLGAGLPKETIKYIALASIMHDVGKIAIPDSILNKTGKLTPEEYDIIKTHTIQGAEMLKKIPQLREHESYSYAYDIARHHHERWDGGGYPDGLKGDEISIWAQVVSLADVYDALVNKRCYKQAFSRAEALDMIRNNKCGVFNPLLLDRFFAVENEIAQLYEHTEKEDCHG